MSRKIGQLSVDVNDLVGEKIGKWYVDSYVGYNHHEVVSRQKFRLRHYYRCVCECGKIRIVRRGNLKAGISLSCGCSRSESGSQK